MARHSRRIVLAALFLSGAACAVLDGASDLTEVACVDACDGAPLDSATPQADAADAADRGAPDVGADSDAIAESDAIATDAIADAIADRAADADADAPSDAAIDAAIDAGPTPIAYVHRVASTNGTIDGGGVSISVTATAATSPGSAILLSVLLSTEVATTAVAATDTGGNTYTVDEDVIRIIDRTVTLSALGANALPVGGKINVTFPKSDDYAVTADEFVGISARDRKASSSGAGATFTSGPTGATSAANELIFAVVGIESGISPNPGAGWTLLPVLAAHGTDFLGSAYHTASSVGSYTVTGPAGGGDWMAAVTTYK